LPSNVCFCALWIKRSLVALTPQIQKPLSPCEFTVALDDCGHAKQLLGPFSPADKF